MTTNLDGIWEQLDLGRVPIAGLVNRFRSRVHSRLVDLLVLALVKTRRAAEQSEYAIDGGRRDKDDDDVHLPSTRMAGIQIPGFLSF